MAFDKKTWANNQGGGTPLDASGLNDLESRIADSIDELDVGIGNRTYTEQNVVTNGESLTASIDKLDYDLQRQINTRVRRLFAQTITTVNNVANTSMGALTPWKMHAVFISTSMSDSGVGLYLVNKFGDGTDGVVTTVNGATNIQAVMLNHDGGLYIASMPEFPSIMLSISVIQLN